jgi:hypothetical protein
VAIWTAPFADGWNAEQNSRGDLGCGGGGTRTDPPMVRLISADRQRVVEIGPGRAAGWLNDVLFAYRPEGTDDLWVASFEVPPSLLASDAGGNTMRAADGHWMAVRAQEGLAVVWYDDHLLFSGRGYDGGAVAGEQLIHVGVDDDGWPQFWHYTGGAIKRKVRIPASGNALTLDAQGNVGSGYNSESWFSRAGATANELVTVTPWRQESPPVPVQAPDGTLWLWTATTSPGGRSLVLGRPYGAQDCIVVDLVAAWLRVRPIGELWSIVAVDGGGQLRTTTVPLTEARRPVPRDVITPPPPPPPPDPIPIPNPPKPPEPKMVTPQQILASAQRWPWDFDVQFLARFRDNVWLRDQGGDVPSRGALAYYHRGINAAFVQRCIEVGHDLVSPDDWGPVFERGTRDALAAYKREQGPGPEDPQ